MWDIHESSSFLQRRGRSVRTIAARPHVSEPLLQGDSPVDARGASIYGSVLRDGGVFRMWHQAWPEDTAKLDSAAVGYAENDDGNHWHKPALGLVDHGGSRANNLVNLQLHSPSVLMDPTAPAAHRYRATGFSRPGDQFEGRPAGVGRRGYYTAHSSDGLHWELDENEPRWEEGDVTLRWKQGRLMGLQAPLYDELELQLPEDCPGNGSIHAELVRRGSNEVVPGYSRKECEPLRGDDTAARVLWKGRSTLPAVPGDSVFLRLSLNRAAVYQYAVTPADHRASA